MILTGQQTPEGIADFISAAAFKAVVIKTGCDGAWLKPPTANRARCGD
jgi:2-dehydro-3-deoxygluconokinase